MHLTPREQEKLMVVVASDLAKRRKERGRKEAWKEGRKGRKEEMKEEKSEGGKKQGR